jgi:hypothetical protein
MDRSSQGPAFFAYADNYLIDVKFGVIVDVEASRAIRQAEVGAARTMIERTEERFGLKPERLAADTAYGAAPMLNGLVEEKGIAPHIPVFDQSKRDDGTFSRSDFRYDATSDVYHCPGGKQLGTMALCLRARRFYIVQASLTAMYAPSNRSVALRNHRAKIPRDIHEHARDVARSSYYYVLHSCVTVTSRSVWSVLPIIVKTYPPKKEASPNRGMPNRGGRFRNLELRVEIGRSRRRGRASKRRRSRH